MRINQNIAAFNAYRNLNQTQNQLSSSLEKLSSGFRINRAADDASGLVNSENLRAQIGGLRVATRNAQDAISLVQTAEGAQTEVHSLLQRMRDLVVQSGNLGTNDDVALQANQDEIDELVSEIDRIHDQTQFGGLEIFKDFQQSEAEAAVNVTRATAAATADETFQIDATNFVAATETAYDTGPPVVAGATSLQFSDTAASHQGRAVTYEFQVIDGAGAEQETVSVTAEIGADATETAYNLQRALNDADLSDLGTTVNVSQAGDTLSIDAVGGAIATDGYGLVLAGISADATMEGGALFQVGANADQTENVVINAVSATQLGVNAIDVTTGESDDIDAALASIDTAISSVSENRATLGAFQNRMESTIRNLSVATENLSAAESRIRDTDMALEMVEFTRSQILSQAGTAMLAQANLVPQSVLALLQ